MKKITPRQAQAARAALEKVIRTHGLDAVRLVWNRRSQEYRLRMKLARQKADIDKQLAKLNRKYR